MITADSSPRLFVDNEKYGRIIRELVSACSSGAGAVRWRAPSNGATSESGTGSFGVGGERRPSIRPWSRCLIIAADFGDGAVAAQVITVFALVYAAGCSFKAARRPLRSGRSSPPRCPRAETFAAARWRAISVADRPAAAGALLRTFIWHGSHRRYFSERRAPSRSS
jgi:hypothetical protein